MTNDLAGLFADDPEPPSQDVRYRQGVIVSFNRITLENTVLVGGTVMTNLQLQGVGEATLLVPGAVVGILAVGGSAKTYFIAGRIVTPNTADAANAVSLLNSQIYTNQIMTAETCTSTTYTDLATVGPAVTVPVRSSGRILVIATCQINLSGTFLTDSTSFTNARAAFSMSGANTSTASDTDKLLVYLDTDVEVNSPNLVFSRSQGSMTGQAVIDGLSVGLTTLTMKYRKSATAGATNPEFARRTLTVIVL